MHKYTYVYSRSLTGPANIFRRRIAEELCAGKSVEVLITIAERLGARLMIAV